MGSSVFSPGITTLIRKHSPWIKNRTVAIVTHQAAVDPNGYTTVDLLQSIRGTKIAAIMGPEHGYMGTAGPGCHVRTTRHPFLGIPIHSLYGTSRKPEGKTLKGVDTIIFDLQMLAARPYTYLSTLKLTMEAAAENNKILIVADRPIPLPSVIDGPVMQPGFESFVAPLPLPMVYGMTPGETALWIKDHLKLQLDLKISPMLNYFREPERRVGWSPWIPPSPGIKSWESAQCYTATVFSEALPIINVGRETALAFRVLGAKDINSIQLCKDFARYKPQGVILHPFQPIQMPGRNNFIYGVRMTVTDPSAFKPVTIAVIIITCLQKQLGKSSLWSSRNARTGFFDKLFGTDEVRKMLEKGLYPSQITKQWQADIDKFKDTRLKHLLYQKK